MAAPCIISGDWLYTQKIPLLLQPSGTGCKSNLDTGFQTCTMQCPSNMLLIEGKREMSMFGIGGPPQPDDIEYTPTAAEDAAYDRAKAAGDLPIMGEVDGKWVKLKGKDLEEAQRDFRRGDWMFMTFGVISLLLAIAFLAGGLWFFSIFLFPFGAASFYAGYMSARTQSR
jgi:uncharacterized membrane protein